MVDIRQTENYAKFLKSQGWIVERIENCNYFIRKMSLVGSVLKVQRPEKIGFQTIKRLEKKYRVFQSTIEPNLASSIGPFVKKDHTLLLAQGFRLSKSPFLPTKTLHLNLTKSKEAIYANFKKDCRSAIKRGGGLKFKEYSTLKDIHKFHQAWKKSVNFTRYVPSFETLINLKKAFPNKNSLIVASHNNSGSIIGGAIFTKISHENDIVCYYWFGFTNKEGRTSLSQYSLLYKGILWARNMGCKLFDFEGIYDERFPNKSWLGFSHFKRSFGGKEVYYPGCYLKFRLPF